MNIKNYKKIDETDFNIYLYNILEKLKIDLKEYTYTSGFISLLDEKKVNERINIISCNGRFLNQDNIKIITSKEIDNLSIVYMTKKSTFKDNIYIDIIKKSNLDVFIYLEFDKLLNENDKIKLSYFFDELNNLIKNQPWNKYE